MDMTPEEYDKALADLHTLKDRLWGEDTGRAMRRLIEEVEDEKEATITTTVENQMYGDAH